LRRKSADKWYFKLNGPYRLAWSVQRPLCALLIVTAVKQQASKTILLDRTISQ
jgi:hypothetical protein